MAHTLIAGGILKFVHRCRSPAFGIDGLPEFDVKFCSVIGGGTSTSSSLSSTTGNVGGSRFAYVRVVTVIDQSTKYVFIRPAGNFADYVIENRTWYYANVRQRVDSSLASSATEWILPPQSAMPYCWDVPDGSHELDVQMFDRTARVNMDRITRRKPTKIAKQVGKRVVSLQLRESD